MPIAESGLAPINGAFIYYEVAGEGPPFIMIHAGVADSRQWDKEFEHFRKAHRVLRYDLRGYGRSEPVDGEYRHLQDLEALLGHLHFEQSLLLMGCSMGGGLAMDYAMAYPSRVRGLILVGAGPTGLQLDVPDHPKAAEAEKAYNAGDLDLVAELETQIWFDGLGRSPAQTDQTMRKLAYEMNRLALAHEAKKLGKRLPDVPVPAVGRLVELQAPTLVIVGAHDAAYMHAAAAYIVENAPRARTVTVADAAHLPNMDHPEEFRRILTTFLRELSL